MIRERIKGYIAGIFDGEGNISILKDRNYYQLVVRISNLDKSVLDFIEPYLKNPLRYEPARDGRKEYYLRLNGSYAYMFLEEFKEDLQGKRDHAEIGIDFWKTKYGLDKLYARGLKPPSYFEKLERFRRRLMDLNKKPRKLLDNKGSRKRKNKR